MTPLRTLASSLPLLAALSVAPLESAAAQTVVPQAPRLDVVFVIDATGSMGDEIEQVKAHLQATARSITAGDPRPDVRFGIVVYRDRGDEEPSRVVPLTRNVDAIHGELSRIVATGGGDVPEDVDSGLTLAISGMSWDPGAAHLVFLVGDAAPQDYGVDRQALLREARAREIRIHTVQASGMDLFGSRYFASLSNATGGVAEVLTYRRQVVVDGRPSVVFQRGSDVYVTRRALSPAESELSFSELESRRLVVRDTHGVAAAAMAGAVAPGRSERGGGPAYAAAPSAAPADSDIGGIIARESRGAAAARGVAY